MARKRNAALAFALSAALALGTIPAPALAEMAEEAMGTEPVAATQPAPKPANDPAPATQPAAPAEAQMGEEPVAPQSDPAPAADPAANDAELGTAPVADADPAAQPADPVTQSDAADLATQSTVASGMWGTCPWTIDDQGVLTVRPGTGAEQPSTTMADTPWKDYGDQITSVRLVEENGNKVVLPSNSSSLFHGFVKVTAMDLSGADTSKVTNMSDMFHLCFNLTSLNTTGWVTSAVTDMSNLFRECNKLTSLNLSSWRTSAVTDMRSMFTRCTNLVSLDLSGWDTSQVTDMGGMFSNCTSLASLDLSARNTSQVTDMGGMFYDCYSLVSLDLSGWDTSQVTNMDFMFHYCSKLASVEGLSSFKTQAVTTMIRMFERCSRLTSLDLSGWNTSQVTNMLGMFSGCYSLASLNLSGWNTSQVTNAYYMFNACPELARITVGASYAMKSRDMFPAEAAGRLWRSAATGQTYTRDQIVESRSGIADTYAFVWKGLTPAAATLNGTDWSAVYDPAWYAERNPDVARWAMGDDGNVDWGRLLQHFVNNGRREGRSSKQGFELASYYNANPDLRRAFGTDWARYYDHYRTSGQREGRACSGVTALRGAVTSRDGVDWAPVYDANFYAQRNPDVANWARRSFSSGSVLDDAALLQHFAGSGTKECRSGKAGFDVRSYYNANPDLRAAFAGTADWSRYYKHYATNGARENRKCAGANDLVGSVNVLSGTNWAPVYDRAFYGQRNADIASWATRKCGSATVLDDYAMLSHFVSNGRKEGRASKAGFELASYYNANADLRRAFGTDWARYYDHYRGNGQREGRAATGVGQLRGAPTTLESVDWAPVYDANYYAQRNPDVASWARRGFASGSVIDDSALLSHFVNSGTKEARASKSGFDVRAYKGKNADLARAFGNDWKSYYRHYAKFGVNEHRPCA